MATTINVLKRTRTLTDLVYSAWTEWASTTDTAPYIDSELIEYKVDRDFDYIDIYSDSFGKILELTIADGTPFKETLAFLDEKFDSYTITDEYKAQLQAQMMSNMTVAFTQSAMNTALQLSTKEIMIDEEYDGKVKQNLILDKQAGKLDADTLLVDAQNQAIQQQVIDNRYIKASDTLAEYFGTIGAGGLKVDATMNTSLFNIIAELLKGDYELSIPASMAITKVV